MNINTRGVMLCFKYAAQQMINQGGGGKIIGSPSFPHCSFFDGIADVCVLRTHIGACSMAGKRGGFCGRCQITV